MNYHSSFARAERACRAIHDEAKTAATPADQANEFVRTSGHPMAAALAVAIKERQAQQEREEAVAKEAAWAAEQNEAAAAELEGLIDETEESVEAMFDFAQEMDARAAALNAEADGFAMRGNTSVTDCLRAAAEQLKHASYIARNDATDALAAVEGAEAALDTLAS
jgi:predicted RNase H-like nuclease (RuvC/YqgF family)